MGLWYHRRFASEASLCARSRNSADTIDCADTIDRTDSVNRADTIDRADTINRAVGKIASPAPCWWLISYANRVPCQRPLRFGSGGRQDARTDIGACDTHASSLIPFQAFRRGIERMMKSGLISHDALQAFGWEQQGSKIHHLEWDLKVHDKYNVSSPAGPVISRRPKKR